MLIIKFNDCISKSSVNVILKHIYFITIACSKLL